MQVEVGTFFTILYYSFILWPNLKTISPNKFISFKLWHLLLSLTLSFIIYRYQCYNIYLEIKN